MFTRGYGDFFFFLLLVHPAAVPTQPGNKAPKKHRQSSEIHLLTLTLLVGGWNPSEKYEFVCWDYDIPN
jgi:hypothetical protein